MEGDQERIGMLHKIEEMLLNAGYFRARISSLSPFDKLTGGLAWCITASNVDVEYDLFYDDDATLGYKIKVGEAIESSLQKMGCPYPLQAHQIQGLDYPAVLVVVQWLVKQVLETREKLGSQLRKYSHLRFRQHFELSQEAACYHEETEGFKQASIHDLGRRIYKHTIIKPMSQEQKPVSHLSIIPTKDMDVADKVETLVKQINYQEAHIKDLHQQLDTLHQSLEERHKEKKRQKERHHVGLMKEMTEIEGKIKDLDLEGGMQNVLSLLERTKMVEEETEKVQESHNKNGKELQDCLGRAEDSLSLVGKDDEIMMGLQKTFDSEVKNWTSIRTSLAQISREVAKLQRHLDDMPSQSELIQYEHGFMELFVNIQAKLRETRKYFSTYNAFAEANDISLKEISILNSINSQFESAIASPEGRESIVQSLEGIAKSVQQKLDRMNKRHEEANTAYASLKNKHASLLATQRQYFAVMKEFQEQCARNEDLRLKLEKSGTALKLTESR